MSETLSDHDLNLAIARMMPGWTEWTTWERGDCEGKYPAFRDADGDVYLYEDAKTGDVTRNWSPSSDLNQAAEAVRAIVGTPLAAQSTWIPALARALPDGASVYEVATAGPRAWCEALAEATVKQATALRDALNELLPVEGKA